MNIVILAAGQGKRMRSSLPKVLHPVAGRPMLAHVIRTARTLLAGSAPARIVVVVGHGADAVEAAFAGERDLTFVRQEPQLGTGHAVRLALEKLDDNALTVVLYGDVPLVTAPTLERLIAAARDGIAVLTVELDKPEGYGRIVRDARGSLVRIVEERDASEGELRIVEVNTGILAAPTRQLNQWLSRLSNDNAQGEYYLTDVVACAVADGANVSAVTVDEPDEILGINSKEQLAQVERIAQFRHALRLLNEGATLADPARIDVRGELDIGTDVSIDIDCVFEGRVVLGDGVRIGPCTLVRDCEIGAGSQVFGFCYLEGASIGANARVGPFARMRPRVKLADDVHIGNFVEVKNSELGTGSKANHLSYVGDATVGRDVNFGAGTIVANYDGANKHRTVVGDNVHTGSNSVLVAPIEIGPGATIGAGSTINKNAPAGKLTLARGKQVTFDAWKRPVKKAKD
jgi:bifunctional UDP-N-acetylglucosamine pyrophosphorylase/glucosamine-1-phosphate N-acetyltransferase